MDDAGDHEVDDAAAEPIEPVEPTDVEVVPVVPQVATTRWMINWPGLIPVVVAVLLVVIVSRSFGGDADDTDDDVAAPATSVSSNTSPPPVSTAPPTTTTTVPATTTTPTTAAVPRVIISGEMKPCRFSNECLVASFRIEGFDGDPDTYTCIYPNSRRDSSFRDGEKLDACFTADEGDTITIEVDGVQSAAVSEENLSP